MIKTMEYFIFYTVYSLYSSLMNLKITAYFITMTQQNFLHAKDLQLTKHQTKVNNCQVKKLNPSLNEFPLASLFVCVDINQPLIIQITAHWSMKPYQFTR